MGIQTARRPFLRQDRLTGPRPLRLEDVVTPEQEDVAHDYTSDMGVSSGENSMQRFRPMPEPVEASVAPELPGMDEEPQQTTQPSNRNRQMAEQLLAHGEKPFSSGAGWWGVADRLAATGVGSWMEGRENDRETAAKKASLDEFLGSLDDNDPVHRYAKTIAVGGDVNKATDLILRHETQKEIAKMRAAQTGGYKQRTYNKGGVEVTEQSQDGGKTWQPLSTAGRYKPEDQNELLTPETRSFMARQYLAGDKSVFLRLPQKEAAALRNQIVTEVKAMKNADGSPIQPSQVNAVIRELDALGKGLGSLATRTANIDTAAAEAREMAKLALQQNGKIPRGKFVPVNKILQNVELAISNPELSQFAMYTTAVASAMATVAGRGTTNQFLQEKFMHMLTTANSPQAYAAQMEAIQREVDAVVKSTGDVREHMIDAYTRGAGSIGAPAGGGHDPAPAAANEGQWEYGTHKNGKKVRRKPGGKWEYY